MADFSEYTGPSAEWVALEPTLPAPPDLSVEELKAASNKFREQAAAQAMVDEGELPDPSEGVHRRLTDS
jgi:hypothetical protein